MAARVGEISRYPFWIGIALGWVALSWFCLDAKTLYLHAIHHFQNRETHPQSQCSFSTSIGKVKPT